MTTPKVDTSPYIFLGLGNPGDEYANHRHNIGAQVIALLARKLGVRLTETWGQARAVRTTWEGQPIVLARSRTYMNSSGEAAIALVRRTSTPTPKFMVICDDMDIPLGAMRLRGKGSSGGQNGMKSVIAHLKTEDFPRLRLGVGRPYPAENRQLKSREEFERDMIKWLLSPFSSSDEKVAAPLRERAVDALQAVLTDGLERAMNTFNTNA